MGFLGNFVDGIRNRGNEDEGDYYLDDDYDYDDGEGDYDDDDYEDEQPKSGGLFSGFGRRNRGASSDEQPKTGGVFSRKVVPIQQNNMEVTMVRPRNHQDDWKELCDDLLDGKAVILNLEGLDDRTAQRIIDQTMGAIYSMGGGIKTISNYIFIASPKNIELTGAFKENINASSNNYRSIERPQQRAAGGFGY